MKSFRNLALTIAALALSTAAFSQTQVTESVQLGALVKTRTLTSDGTYAESTCVVGDNDGVAMRHCVNRTTRLSAKAAASLRQSMTDVGFRMAVETTHSQRVSADERRASSLSTSRSAQLHDSLTLTSNMGGTHTTKAISDRSELGAKN